jgi:serine/threonine protein kinase
VLPPLPIEALARRARNAKSPKERHDAAWFAWEASVRAGVAARPPREPAGLALAPLGRWVAALAPDCGDEAILAAPGALGAFALFAEVGLGRPAAPRSVTARRLLDALPAYRNQVIGHGAPRADAFYERATETLLAGLGAAWDAGVFWPAGARLVRVDAVGPAPRLRDLSAPEGPRPAPEPPAPPPDLAPGRLYIQTPRGFTTLHPWLLSQETELGERILFFNGRRRSAQFLDYVSGEPLRGAALAAAFPAIEDELGALFRAAPAEDGEPEKQDASLFDDYRILGKLGEGGMGVVWLARQESLGRLVALKTLSPGAVDDAVAGARFRREIAALSRADHPNVVKILASGVGPPLGLPGLSAPALDGAPGTPYYAMELVEGGDLAAMGRVLAEGGDFDAALARAAERARGGSPAAAPAPAGRLATSGRASTFREVAGFVRDAARGLHQLHELGIVHRDVKPGNLMITAAERRVVVMDLGVAAVADASRSLTRGTGAVVGTLRYMAPEQLAGARAVDRRADVYGLGATLYELVSGRPLFEAESEARLLDRILRENPAPLRRVNPDVPRDLAIIVEKALAKEPPRRYASAEELAADLDAFLEGRPIAARPPTLGYVLLLALRRNRPIAATIAVALLAAVAGTALFVVAQKRARDREAAARARAEDLLDFMLTGLHERLERIGKVAILGDVARKALDYYTELPIQSMPAADRLRYAVALENLSAVLFSEAHTDEAFAASLRAVEIDRGLLAEDPGDPAREAGLGKALLWYVQALQHAQRWAGAEAARDEAREHLARALAREPTRRDWRYAIAQALNVDLQTPEPGATERLLARSREALAILERLIAEEPGNADYLALAAATEATVAANLGSMEHNPEALAELVRGVAFVERAAATRPDDVRIESQMGGLRGEMAEILQALGRGAEAVADERLAIEAFERILAVDPTNARGTAAVCVARERLGELLTAGGDVVGATAAYGQSAEIAERFLAPGRRDTELEIAIARARRAEGELLAAAGHREEAIASLAAARKALAPYLTPQADASTTDIAQALGANCLWVGAFDEAEACFRALADALASSTPAQPGLLAGARSDLARTLEMRGDLAGATAAIHAALAALDAAPPGERSSPPISPEQPPFLAEDYRRVSAAVLGDEAAILCRTGDLPGATTAVARALAISPRSNAALAARAAIREAQGDVDGARADADAVLAQDNRRPLALLVRGRVRAARGEAEGAIADLGAFLEAAPYDARAGEVRALVERLRARERDLR